MIIAVRQFQNQGKTALAMILIKEFLRIGARYINGFRQSDVVGNVIFKDMPEAHSCNNARLKAYIKAMVEKGTTHKIVFADEADRIWPARFWQKPEQTESLIGLWQDYKLFNILIWTAHEGTGVDVILRSVTHIELTPKYINRDNAIYARVYNGLEGVPPWTALFGGVSRIFPAYDRWERSL
jgi:hypothetical protein